MILPAKRGPATVAICRLGELCDISEPAGATTTDGYGKTREDDLFEIVDSESVVRVYGKGATDPTASRHTGGRLPADSPLLVFRHDTVAQEGFRVTYLSDTYEIDSMSRYPSHIEARTTLVN
jgi:hypothetical protein